MLWKERRTFFAACFLSYFLPCHVIESPHSSNNNSSMNISNNKTSTNGNKSEATNQ